MSPGEPRNLAPINAKLDTLVVDTMATRLDRKEIQKGIDDDLDIGTLRDPLDIPAQRNDTPELDRSLRELSVEGHGASGSWLARAGVLSHRPRYHLTSQSQTPGRGGSAMEEPRTIRVGMSVQSADGEQLGTVVEVTDDALRIAKGLISRTEYRVLRTEVQTVAADTVTLSQSAGELVRSGSELRGEDMPAEHAGDVLQAASSTHDLAEEEEALQREAVQVRLSDERSPPTPEIAAASASRHDR